ncbi:hypothetical protein AAC387_Pa11g0765 [Persea americana]
MDSDPNPMRKREEEEEGEEVVGTTPPSPIFRDIRRYYCDYCGICRSKKSLISSHIQSQHKDEIKDKEKECDDERPRSYDCKECGASFKKPSYLKQHMQSHSIVRSFTCSIDDCNSSYRRKDHLTRHLLRHQGKLFICPTENCNRKFAFQGNMKRHVKEFHDEDSHDTDVQKQHICQECGKKFKFASKLRKHEDSHVKLDSVEAICCEPGCMKVFSNTECLKDHLRLCHQYVPCEVCGTQQLKKNIMRHLRTHEDKDATESIKCSFQDCSLSFSTTSNLKQHIKAVHLGLRPFTCHVSGCRKKFPFKHVRDNHERSAAHVYMHGDFLESDEQFRSRARGGLKRKSITVETLLRKRVVPPGQSSILDNGSEYLNWLLSDDSNEP